MCEHPLRSIATNSLRNSTMAMAESGGRRRRHVQAARAAVKSA
jgi:hypothetical protein